MTLLGETTRARRLVSRKVWFYERRNTILCARHLSSSGRGPSVNGVKDVASKVAKGRSNVRSFYERNVPRCPMASHWVKDQSVRLRRRRVPGGASRDGNVALCLSNPFCRCHSRSSKDVTSSNEFQGVTNCSQPPMLVPVRFLATSPGESVVTERDSLCRNQAEVSAKLKMQKWFFSLIQSTNNLLPQYDHIRFIYKYIFDHCGPMWVIWSNIIVLFAIYQCKTFEMSQLF